MAICLDAAAAAAAAAAIVPRPKWLTQSTRRLTNWSTVERTGRQWDRPRDSDSGTERQTQQLTDCLVTLALLPPSIRQPSGPGRLHSAQLIIYASFGNFHFLLKFSPRSLCVYVCVRVRVRQFRKAAQITNKHKGRERGGREGYSKLCQDLRLEKISALITKNLCAFLTHSRVHSESMRIRLHGEFCDELVAPF